jgi:hypothetical protein
MLNQLHRPRFQLLAIAQTTLPGRLLDLSKSTPNSYAIYNTTNKPKTRTHEGPFNIYQIIGPVHWHTGHILFFSCIRPQGKYIFWTLFFRDCSIFIRLMGRCIFFYLIQNIYLPSNWIYRINLRPSQLNCWTKQKKKQTLIVCVKKMYVLSSREI